MVADSTLLEKPGFEQDTVEFGLYQTTYKAAKMYKIH